MGVESTCLRLPYSHRRLWVTPEAIQSPISCDNVVNQPKLYRIPPTRTLITFESAARHQSFAKAAKELGMFQSAVSRQIATLEEWVSVPLFKRSPTGVTLTEAGKRLYESIATGLGEIYRGIATTANVLNENKLIIACAHGVSQCIVMPRYAALCDELGEGVGIRVMVYDQDIKYLAPDPVADVALTWKDTRGARTISRADAERSCEASVFARVR